MNHLIEIITSSDEAIRNQSLESRCCSSSLQQLLDDAAALDRFRRDQKNLYFRVRALFFLYSVHRFQIPAREGVATRGLIPFQGYEHLLQRRFEEIRIQRALGPVKDDGVIVS